MAGCQALRIQCGENRLRRLDPSTFYTQGVSRLKIDDDLQALSSDVTPPETPAPDTPKIVADHPADYNPLGQFGAAWASDFLRDRGCFTSFAAVTPGDNQLRPVRPPRARITRFPEFGADLGRFLAIRRPRRDWPFY